MQVAVVKIQHVFENFTDGMYQSSSINDLKSIFLHVIFTKSLIASLKPITLTISASIANLRRSRVLQHY